MDIRRQILFPDYDPDDPFGSFEDDDGPFIIPSPRPRPPQINPVHTNRPSLSTPTPTTRLPLPHSPSVTSPPMLPFADEGRSELSSGRQEPPLSTTALVFIGLSGFILFVVIVAGMYFWIKSKRSVLHGKHGGGGPHSSKKKPVEPKGRGVTRPSFLPTHGHQINPNGTGGEASKPVRPHAVPESIHLDIPSPEWSHTSYQIKTPYSFPSTSTVVTDPESDADRDSQPHVKVTKAVTIFEKPVPTPRAVYHQEQEQPNQQHQPVRKIPLQPVPQKPGRSKPNAYNGVSAAAPELSMGDGLPSHRITVY